MANLFLGKNALRFKYYELLTTDITTATSMSSAVSLLRARQDCRLLLFNNSMNVDLGFACVHPENDAGDPTQRLFLFEIGATSVLNFDISGTVGLSIDAGTSIFVWNRGGGTPTLGTKLRVVAWG